MSTQLTFILEPCAGELYYRCIDQAIKIAVALDCEVKFKFNGKNIKVDKNSDYSLVCHEYSCGCVNAY